MSDTKISEELPQIQIQTDRGDMTIEMFEDHAPNTVAKHPARKMATTTWSSGCMDINVGGGTEVIHYDPTVEDISEAAQLSHTARKHSFEDSELYVALRA